MKRDGGPRRLVPAESAHAESGDREGTPRAEREATPFDVRRLDCLAHGDAGRRAFGALDEVGWRRSPLSDGDATDHTAGRLMVAPSVILLFLWMIVPLAMTLYFSTLQLQFARSRLQRSFVGLGNYLDFLLDPTFSTPCTTLWCSWSPY